MSSLKDIYWMASPLAIDQRIDLNDKGHRILKPVARYIDPKNEVHVFRKIEHWTLEIDGKCYELSPNTKKKLTLIKKAYDMCEPRSVDAMQWRELKESQKIEPETRKIGQTRKTHNEIIADAEYLWKNFNKEWYGFFTQNCQNFAHMLFERIAVEIPDAGKGVWDRIPDPVGYRLAEGARLALAGKVAHGTRIAYLGAAATEAAPVAEAGQGVGAAGTMGTTAGGSASGGTLAAGGTTAGGTVAGGTGTAAGGATGTIAAGGTTASGRAAAGATTAGGTVAGGTGTAAGGGTGIMAAGGTTTSGTAAAGATTASGTAAAGVTTAGGTVAGGTGTAAGGGIGTISAGGTTASGTAAAGGTTAGGTVAGGTGTAATGGTSAGSTAAGGSAVTSGHVGLGAKAAGLMHGGHAAATGSGMAKAAALTHGGHAAAIASVAMFAHPVTGLAVTGGLAYLAYRGKKGKGWNKQHKKLKDMDVSDGLKAEDEALEQAENPDQDVKEELDAALNDPDQKIDAELVEELKLELGTTEAGAMAEEHEAVPAVQDTESAQTV